MELWQAVNAVAIWRVLAGLGLVELQAKLHLQPGDSERLA